MPDAHDPTYLLRAADPYDHPPVIGLAGYRRSGKDTLADGLVALGWAKVGMSEPLADALRTLDPWVEVPEDFGRGVREHDGYATLAGEHVRFSEIEARVGYDEAKTIPEVRRLLTTLGTDVVREIDPDVWVRAARNKILAHVRSGRPVVVTRTHYANEREMIRSFGGLLVYVHRPTLPLTEHAVPRHSSEEIDPDDFDLALANSGTAADLAGMADYVAQTALVRMAALRQRL